MKDTSLNQDIQYWRVGWMDKFNLGKILKNSEAGKIDMRNSSNGKTVHLIDLWMDGQMDCWVDGRSVKGQYYFG